MKDYRTEFPLEYCASRFLTQWMRHEETLYKCFSSDPTIEDIREALSYFKVSRNFKGLNNEVGKIEIIRNELKIVKSDVTLTSELKVTNLARAFEEHFDQFNLSAATKLLWLSYREPFVIYDIRAVNALSQKFKHSFAKRRYDEYSNAWRLQYAKYKLDIEQAIQTLPEGRIFMPRCSLNDNEIVALAKEEWFKERVFDIFLWEIGGNN